MSNARISKSIFLTFLLHKQLFLKLSALKRLILPSHLDLAKYYARVRTATSNRNKNLLLKKDVCSVTVNIIIPSQIIPGAFFEHPYFP